ncbi:Major Facilitator Superfamily protein [Trichomonas vaginalis G3]|uniref:Molybdate-anion transporter n=1 Tax=Trichomonas vaginalis (strain ATCC PRA-98 / G3) TaxID=412133 RepID=A2F0E2_TRIV3|nr:major facilitator superfamily transporter [Trichomonas vaginalis G3]EAY01637.1 Major Facilitator Superfamily protein [Trichomonas vaginalis G3]KAI5551602.1 molybdate ion transmembrane transporter protein [Trichomonas vaginalis G3]|eukprot:XP_001330369.1 major facilitator superfamily transporter [Trichomonas vaginalis G3]
MIPLNHTLVLWVFIVTVTIGSITKLLKWWKVKQIKDSLLTKLQIKYFICYFSFMAGFIFQGPYVHQRYHETGMTNPQIDNIMSIFNVVSAIWGFVIGYACDLLGHKNLIIISAILLGGSSFCRSYGTYYSFIISSVLMGVSTASNRVVFEDWLAVQLEQNKAPKESQAIIKENSALLNFCLNLILSQISSKVSTAFGSKYAFIGSTILFSVSAFIIFVTMPKFTREHEKKSSYFGAIKEIILNFKNFEYAIFFIIDFLYSMILLLYNPRWTVFHKINKTEKIPLSQISNSASISQMNGAQILSAAILFFSPASCLAGSFVSYSFCIFSMYLFYNTKSYMFLAYVCAAMSNGAINSGIWTLRSEIYPSSIRKHLLGIVRVPVSLVVTLILQLMKGSETVDILFVIVCLAFTTATLMTILGFHRKLRNPKSA